MTPIASPNKSWEGSAGGILFACLGALAARELFFPDLVLWKAFLIAVLVHAAAQVERSAGVAVQAGGRRQGFVQPLARPRRIPRQDRQPDPRRAPVLLSRRAPLEIGLRQTWKTAARTLVILGSTGSIGRSTLEVAGRLRERFRVIGLAAGSNVSLLLEQAASFRAGDRLPEDGARRRGVPSPLRAEEGPGGLRTGRSGRGRRPAGERHRRFRHYGHRRSWPDAGRRQGRDQGRPGQQGVPGRRRRVPQEGGSALRSPDHSRGQRAQRRLPMPGRGETPIREAGHPDGLRRALLPDPRFRDRGQDSRRGPAPSALEDGDAR